MQGKKVVFDWQTTNNYMLTKTAPFSYLATENNEMYNVKSP